MLDPQVFKSEFIDFLCVHYRIELTSPRLIKAYYEAFQHYGDATFSELCELAFRESVFMPVPLWFADRAEELASRAIVNPEYLLSSAEEAELERLTVEELAVNRKRISDMMKSALKVLPGGKK
jgi:hypothetical protein